MSLSKIYLEYSHGLLKAKAKRTSFTMYYIYIGLNPLATFVILISFIIMRPTVFGTDTKELGDLNNRHPLFLRGYSHESPKPIGQVESDTIMRNPIVRGSPFAKIRCMFPRMEAFHPLIKVIGLWV